MRRPSKTKKQRDFDKKQRALLQLRRKAVHWSISSHIDDDGSKDGDALIFALTDLQTAADKYTATPSTREQRKLLK